MFTIMPQPQPLPVNSEQDKTSAKQLVAIFVNKMHSVYFCLVKTMSTVIYQFTAL